MQHIIKSDLQYVVRRLPRKLAMLMESERWYNKIFVGGGFIRSIIANETINDIDVFVTDKQDAEVIAAHLSFSPSDIHKTANAITIKGSIPVQIITRWIFAKPADVANSFDFTVCCSVVSFNGTSWEGLCDVNFYPDLAGKRLVYRVPVRNEDAGGSILRVLKYYQRGYRIPLNCLAAVIARLIKNLNTDLRDEQETAKVLTGFLFEVDPNTVMHEAYLPVETESVKGSHLQDNTTGEELKGITNPFDGMNRVTRMPFTDYSNIVGGDPLEGDAETPLTDENIEALGSLRYKVMQYLKNSHHDEGSKQRVKDILARFQAKKVTELHPDDYNAFQRAFDALK